MKAYFVFSLRGQRFVVGAKSTASQLSSKQLRFRRGDPPKDAGGFGAWKVVREGVLGFAKNDYFCLFMMFMKEMDNYR